MAGPGKGGKLKKLNVLKTPKKTAILRNTQDAATQQTYPRQSNEVVLNFIFYS